MEKAKHDDKSQQEVNSTTDKPRNHGDKNTDKDTAAVERTAADDQSPKTQPSNNQPSGNQSSGNQSSSTKTHAINNQSITNPEPDEPDSRPGAPIVPDPFFFPEPYSVWD